MYIYLKTDSIPLESTSLIIPFSSSIMCNRNRAFRCFDWCFDRSIWLPQSTQNFLQLPFLWFNLTQKLHLFPFEFTVCIPPPTSPTQPIPEKTTGTIFVISFNYKVWCGKFYKNNKSFEERLFYKPDYQSDTWCGHTSCSIGITVSNHLFEFLSIKVIISFHLQKNV